MARLWFAALIASGLFGAACGGGGGETPDVGDDAQDAGDVDDTGDAGDVDDTTDSGDVPDGLEETDSDEDGIDGDDTVDGEETTDGDDAEAEAKRTAISPTSGGGQVSSPNYRMRVYVGTPQPMGSAAGSSYRAGFGPGAQGNQ